MFKSKTIEVIWTAGGCSAMSRLGTELSCRTCCHPGPLVVGPGQGIVPGMVLPGEEGEFATILAF